EVLFGYDFFSKAHLLRLTGPSVVQAGHSFTVKVTDGKDNSPVPSAAIAGGGPAQTDDGGTATLAIGSAGVVSLKAQRADSLRSNALPVCVYAASASECAGRSGSGPLGAGRSPKAVLDRTPPVARISAPR